VTGELGEVMGDDMNTGGCGGVRRRLKAEGGAGVGGGKMRCIAALDRQTRSWDGGIHSRATR